MQQKNSKESPSQNDSENELVLSKRDLINLKCREMSGKLFECQVARMIPYEHFFNKQFSYRSSSYSVIHTLIESCSDLDEEVKEELRKICDWKKDRCVEGEFYFFAREIQDYKAMHSKFALNFGKQGVWTIFNYAGNVPHQKTKCFAIIQINKTFLLGSTNLQNKSQTWRQQLRQLLNLVLASRLQRSQTHREEIEKSMMKAVQGEKCVSKVINYEDEPFLLFYYILADQSEKVDFEDSMRCVYPFLKFYFQKFNGCLNVIQIKSKTGLTQTYMKEALSENR